MIPPASTLDWLDTLPAGDLEDSSTHTSSTFRSDLEQKELDGARIHVYLMFYEAHALLWSSLEQQFYEFSEQRLNSALAFLEEIDAITIEPAPPPNPWSPDDALVSISHSHRSLYSDPLPLPWPGSHIESPIVPATPAPLPFGFPVAVSEEEYAEEIGRDQWTGGKTPFERMASEGFGAEEHGHVRRKSASGSIRIPGKMGSIPATPKTMEGDYFPPMPLTLSPNQRQRTFTASSSHSDHAPQSFGQGSTTPRARRTSGLTALHPMTSSSSSMTSDPHQSRPQTVHAHTFAPMSIPRTHSLYSLDQLGFSGGHRGRMSGIIPATATPPSSDWPSVAPTPVFGPTKRPGEEAADEFELELESEEGLDGALRDAMEKNTRANIIGADGGISRIHSEPGRSRSGSRDAGTEKPSNLRLDQHANGFDRPHDGTTPAMERPASVSSNSRKELRFDLPEGQQSAQVIRKWTEIDGGESAVSSSGDIPGITDMSNGNDTQSVFSPSGGVSDIELQTIEQLKSKAAPAATAPRAAKEGVGQTGFGRGMGMQFLPLL